MVVKVVIRTVVIVIISWLIVEAPLWGLGIENIQDKLGRLYDVALGSALGGWISIDMFRDFQKRST